MKEEILPQMDDSVFLVLDFGAVCRLCLSGRLLSDIHEEDAGPADTPPLGAQIALLTGVQISQEDSLPQKICYKCRYLVDAAYELRAAAVRAECLLLAGLSSADEKDGDNLEQIEPVEVIDELVDFLDQPATDCLEDIDYKAEITDYIGKMEDRDPDDTEDVCGIEGFLYESAAAEINFQHISGDISSRGATKKIQYKKKVKVPKSKNTCELCLATFPTREQLVPHVRRHYAGAPLTPYVDLRRPYRCEACAQPTRGRRALLEHHARHLDMNPFVCGEPGCSFVGKSKESLRHHGYRHGARAFVCETCGAAFRRTWELKQHGIRHADEGARFPCRYCRVVCRNRLTHRAHLKSHERGRRFKCDRVGCPKAFFSRADLSVHTRSHDNARIYRCHLCVSSYISQSQLNRHLRRHRLRRVNKCDKCSATFNSYADYFNHRVGTHGAFQPHKCIGCNQGYQSEAHLDKHMAHCKLAQNLKELLPTDDSAALDLPGLDQKDRSLLCNEESLDALLLRNLKPGDTARASRLAHGEAPALAADGLLYIDAEDMDIQSYPSPSPPAPPHHDAP